MNRSRPSSLRVKPEEVVVAEEEVMAEEVADLAAAAVVSTFSCFSLKKN